MTPIKTNLILVAVLFASLILTACGGGGGGDGTGGSSAAPVAKVVIQQSGLVLTAMGATKQLSAVAYDAQGQVVNASIRWSSTQPAISVDGTGKVTAASNNGSSQIVAEAENIKSAPLIAIVTTFPVDAVLLTDAQIVGEPFETNPTALPSVDNTYKVTLTGVSAPAMGALLINAESKPVAGRVVAVDTAAGQTTVTLAQVSMREAFPNLELNEVIDLTNAEIIFPADVTAGYDIQRIGNTINFTPKATAAAPVLLKSAANTTNQPSAKLVTLPGGVVVDCVPTITGDGTNLPIQLSVPPTISITRNISLDTKYSVLNGLERLVLKSEVAAKVEASVGVTVAFEGKVSCEKELYVIRIPVGGPLSLFVGGLVPIKAGFEAGGKVTVASASLGIKAEGKLVSEYGVVCPDGTNCALTGSLTPTGTAVPVFDLPDIGDLRFEPTFSGFAKAELAIGNPTFTRLRLDTFYLQAGPKLAFSFAPQLSQIADVDYKSNYVLQTEKKLGLGHKFGDAMKRLGIETISAFEIAEVVEIGKSPTGTVTADRTTFVAGDVINFRVALDAGTVDLIPLLGPYNVSRILLVSNDGPLSTSVIASVNATDGQTVFDIPYTATRAGNVSEIFAFVDTWIIPTRDLLTLEVGNATGVSASKIAFTSGRDGNNEIYVMNADGSGQTRLTNNTADDREPAWSPDGTRIAFQSYRDGNFEIYVMNADGSGQTNLTNNAAHDSQPAWSPDGTRIAFASTRHSINGNGNDEIYLMNADGSGQTRLTNDTANAAAPDSQPAWSPDGTRIAFTSNRDGTLEIYVMNADGSGKTSLNNYATNTVANDFDPRDFDPMWSPDGTRIAFTSRRDGNGNFDIYVMNADGSGQTRLTNNTAVEGEPTWSPDGTRIAFQSSRDGNNEIYVMNADGSGQTNLTNNAAADAYPAWSR